MCRSIPGSEADREKGGGREEVRTCESKRELKSDIKLYIHVYMCKTQTYYDSCSNFVGCSYGDIMVMPVTCGNVFYSMPGRRSTAPSIGVQQP